MKTKPVIHEHDWVRMTLGGIVEQAWNGTVFGSASYEDPDGYVVSFLPRSAELHCAILVASLIEH